MEPPCPKRHAVSCYILVEVYFKPNCGKKNSVHLCAIYICLYINIVVFFDVIAPTKSHPFFHPKDPKKSRVAGPSRTEIGEIGSLSQKDFGVCDTYIMQ